MIEAKTKRNKDAEIRDEGPRNSSQINVKQKRLTGKRSFISGPHSKLTTAHKLNCALCPLLKIKFFWDQATL